MFNTLRPRQNGRRFADDTFKCIFLNETVLISIKISLKFTLNGPINNIPALVQIMAWRHCFLTHICVTLPQWVNLRIVGISCRTDSRVAVIADSLTLVWRHGKVVIRHPSAVLILDKNHRNISFDTSPRSKQVVGLSTQWRMNIVNVINVMGSDAVVILGVRSSAGYNGTELVLNIPCREY